MGRPRDELSQALGHWGLWVEGRGPGRRARWCSKIEKEGQAMNGPPVETWLVLQYVRDIMCPQHVTNKQTIHQVNIHQQFIVCANLTHV